ncbi:hypothetical protein [Caulobacter sp. S45]|uniref:hypothetical protein n=1 Tax=Caulobacter sp. S45 TaxID=1641861 RepID=UPI00157645A0|nr:hypothetical protein [Caulobacter sp. S45]
MHFTENDLSEMLGTMLRQRTASAKDLAHRIRVDPRAAEGYRAGRHLPPLPVFFRIVGALGDDIREALQNPVETHARLTAEIDAAERAAAEKRRIRDALAGRPAGVEAVSPASEGVQAR